MNKTFVLHGFKIITLCFGACLLLFANAEQEQPTHYKVIVIGAGPAGLTAATYAARAKLSTLVLKEDEGGQLSKAVQVRNWPGEVEISGHDLIQKLEAPLAQLGATIETDKITKVDLKKRPFVLNGEDKTYTADAIVIATGTRNKKIHVGEEKFIGKGVNYCAWCDAALYNDDKPVVVVGGGTSALNNALLLAKYTKDITLIESGDKLTAYPDVQEEFKHHVPDAKILFNTKVVKIEGDDEMMKSISIKNSKTGKTESLTPKGLFVCVGLEPNTKFLENQVKLNDKKQIVTKNIVETSVPGVYAVGNVSDIPYSQAIVCAGCGAIAGIKLEKYFNAKEAKEKRPLYNQYVD